MDFLTEERISADIDVSKEEIYIKVDGVTRTTYPFYDYFNVFKKAEADNIVVKIRRQKVIDIIDKELKKLGVKEEDYINQKVKAKMGSFRDFLDL